ncbi:MAG: hypothetical protein KDA41_03000, partial [Planctomycetales bacterium]|nr:hypothetical protein [Planctomycetales bacterium]
MSIEFSCKSCASALMAPDEYAGRKAECPQCGAVTIVPAASTAPAEPIEAEVIAEAPAENADNPWEMRFLDALHGPEQVSTFFEPPAAPPAPPSGRPARSSEPWLRRMFEAALDPRSIQWLLTIGGGLMLLGALVWLISRGVLENPLVVAVILGLASLGVLVGGWLLALRTRYKMAGRALTFLGCVVAPLNLWFYHAQGLLMLDQGLWVGGVACVGLFITTVWVLRDPLFVYAVEAGVTLTSVLLLAN